VPNISVIVPNYNHAPFLKQRIESILDQTYQDFELILLDDCSTDNSKEIIEIYRNHPKVSRIEYNECNSGSTFQQLYKGITLAQAEWIWIAESDDYCEPELLEAFIELLKKNRGDLVFCRSKIVDEKGRLLREQKLDIGWEVALSEQFLESYMYFDNLLINFSAVLFRKARALATWNAEIYSFKLSGDWFFWANFLKGSTVVYLNQTLNYYRKHKVTVSNESTKKGLWLREGLRVQQWIEANYIISKEKQSQLSNVLYFRFFKEFKKIEKNHRSTVFWRVWKRFSYLHKIKGIILFHYLLLTDKMSTENLN
jgi:glycosyltransferase involved in cell wall biosynthesis